MIYGNLQNLADYPDLSEALKVCFDYAKTHDLLALPKGSYPIRDDSIKVNVSEFTTSPLEGHKWEAHRKYLDIHLVLSGAERIDTAGLQHMDVGPYEEDRDFVPMQGECDCINVLRAGDFLVCFPTDAHRVGICVGEPAAVKKAIFKVRI